MNRRRCRARLLTGACQKHGVRLTPLPLGHTDLAAARREASVALGHNTKYCSLALPSLAPLATPIRYVPNEQNASAYLRAMGFSLFASIRLQHTCEHWASALLRAFGVGQYASFRRRPYCKLPGSDNMRAECFSIFARKTSSAQLHTSGRNLFGHGLQHKCIASVAQGQSSRLVSGRYRFKSDRRLHQFN